MNWSISSGLSNAQNLTVPPTDHRLKLKHWEVTYSIIRSRLKSKHESELFDVETEIRTLREKMTKVREEAAAAEEANIVLRAEIRQKDVDLDEVKKVTK